MGNKYLDVINALLDQGLIVANTKYSPKRYSKSFRLTSKLYDEKQILSVDLKSRRFTNRLDKLRRYEQQGVLKNPLYVKIISNTLKISFIDDFVHYIPLPDSIGTKEINGHIVTEYEDNDFQMNRYSEFGKILN